MQLTKTIAAQPAQPRHGPSIPWLALFAILVFVAYPVSTGPVYKLVDENILPRRALAIYRPLLTVLFPYTGTTLHWYIFDVWEVKMVD